MLTFVKHGQCQLICFEKYITKEIKKTSRKYFQWQRQHKIHLFCFQTFTNIKRCKGKIPFFQGKQKFSTVRNEYLLEDKKGRKVEEKQKEDRNNIKKENTKHKSAHYAHREKQAFFSFKANDTEIIDINEKKYVNLNPLFSLIDSINKDILKINNTSLKVVRYLVSINHKLYLFSFQIENENERGKNYFEIIKRDFIKQKTYFELCKAVSSLHFFSLASLFSLVHEIQQLQIQRGIDVSSNTFCPFHHIEAVVTDTLCTYIRNFLLTTKRGDTKKAADSTKKNIYEENKNGVEKCTQHKHIRREINKRGNSDKKSLRETYIHILNTLNILKEKKKQYANNIISILSLLYKNVHKHKRQYNFVFAMSLLKLLNEMIHWEVINTFKDESRRSVYIENVDKHKQEEEEENKGDTENREESSKLCISLPAPTGNNFFHLQTDEHTSQFANICFEEINLCGIENGVRNDMEQKTKEKNNKETISFVVENQTDESKGTIDGNSKIDITTLHRKTDNTSIEEDAYISQRKESLIVLLQYNTMLLAVLNKKMKYVENKVTFEDVKKVLNNINMLNHINVKITNINNLIDETNVFFKNVILTPHKEVRFLSLLQQVTASLLFIKFKDMFKKMEKGNHEHNQQTENFLEIVAYLSNIRNVITLFNKPKMVQTRCNTNYANEKKTNSSIEKIVENKEYKQNRENEETEGEMKKMIINKINKNIGVLINNIILLFFNNEKLVENTQQFSSSPKAKLHRNHIITYMSIILNDLYLQNVYQLKEFIFFYFLKNKSSCIFTTTCSKEEIYLEYITLYNWLKIYKKEINEALTKNPNSSRSFVSPSSQFGYNKILKMFTNHFSITHFQQIQEERDPFTKQEIERETANKENVQNCKEAQLLYLLNTLHYFFFISKKCITNMHFLNQINYYFFLTLSLLNKHIEKKKYNSLLEQFSWFANQCISKIINILLIHKYCNLLTKETILCLLTFLQNTYHVLDLVKKEKIRIHLLPFFNKHSEDIRILEQLLDNEKETQKDEGIEIKDGQNEIEKTPKTKRVEENKNKEVIAALNKNKEELYLKKEMETANTIVQEEYIYHDMDTAFNLFEDVFKKSEQPQNYSTKKESFINEEFVDKNIEEKKNEINKLCKTIEKSKLVKLLGQHMLELEIVKKENYLLKKKLNYIFLNLENFINSHIHFLLSKDATPLLKNGLIKVKQAEYIITKNDSVAHTPGLQESEQKRESEKDAQMETKQTQTQKIENGTVKKMKIKITPSANTDLHINYQQIKVTDEYFRELQKYEKENYRNINNVLINMYIYNPYVYIKHKKVEEKKKEEKKKKILFLPYETYKNIQIIVNKNNAAEEKRLLHRIQLAISLFFCKMWKTFKMKTRKQKM